MIGSRSVLAATLALWAGAALAQDADQDWAWCRAELGGAHAVSPELKIRGCTAHIEAPGETPRRVSFALVMRGSAYFAQKQDAQGFADLRRAVQVDPTFSYAWAESCSYDMWRKKDSKLAMQECSKAIEVNPKDASGWTYRGDIYLNLRDYERAEADYTHAIELAPRWMWPWDNRGEAYLRAGDVDRAIQDFEQVIKVQPDYAMGYLDRGIANFKKRQYAVARADFEAGLKVDPKCTACLLGRGLVRRTTGDPAGGDADIAAAKAMNPEAGRGFKEDGVAVP